MRRSWPVLHAFSTPVSKGSDSASSITRSPYSASDVRWTSSRTSWCGSRTRVTMRHAQIVMNVATRLHAAARGGPCRVITADVKVRVSDERYYYPDVAVVSTPMRPDDTIITDPCLIVEVTSPSTARVDRGEKRQAYLKMQ